MIPFPIIGINVIDPSIILLNRHMRGSRSEIPVFGRHDDIVLCYGNFRYPIGKINKVIHNRNLIQIVKLGLKMKPFIID